MRAYASARFCQEQGLFDDLAQRLKRVFSIEIEKCEKCGGKARIIASIEDPDVIEKILKHPGLDETSQVRNRSPPSDLFDYSSQLF